MKKSSLIASLLGLACIGTILIGCETTQSGAASAAPPNSGRVIINRVANFGSNLSLIVSIDGRDVGSFTEGRTYSGYLPAGQHTITARVDPNPGSTRPGHAKLNIVAGQTYSYTAAWSGGKLVLVRNR